MIKLLSKYKNDVEILTTPNFETYQAMEDAVNGKIIRVNSSKELMASFKSYCLLSLQQISLKKILNYALNAVSMLN